MRAKKAIISLALTSLLGAAAFLPDLPEQRLSWLSRIDPSPIRYSGFVEAYAFTVAAEVAGRMQSLSVREGDTLSGGDVVAQMDETYAELRVRQAEAALALARASGGNGDAGDAALGRAASPALFAAQVAQAEHFLDLARLERDRHTVRAGRGGTVQRIHVHPGQALGPGAPIATLIDRQDLKVRIYVPAEALPQFTPGGKVRLNEGKETFSGTVEQVSDQEEFSPFIGGGSGNHSDRVFAVKIAIREGWERLRPGMSVQVELGDGEN
ncbi:HlyD family efflux transporter periplasmic adaptor subunit [Heliobacterium undosum]|uniref:HlyD family efflux transporter periplasmic adaptor subunit n=1 Tax=Heliomicrobium undosum TaxID=121734 RepID=A0A845L0F2_9FIRM|nr:HlyD family efflux transporter periplasmic adaptor subunit [Heliomicrobium undosum]MZP28379.1 HlyD family efflux transporter periplasmic adaptor subunit [Heliomicrobium undosum]